MIANKTASKPATPAVAPPKAPTSAKDGKDAIALLKADHDAVSHLFAEYAKTHSASNKKALVAEICTALSVHAQIEEEIFYPAVKAALADKRLVPEAMVEQEGVKGLVEQLQHSEPDGAMYDAKVKVLAEYVKHHVHEEQKAMFPKARAASLDMMELGARMAARRQDLLARAS
jgi:hemerythrin superfamily protein